MNQSSSSLKPPVLTFHVQARMRQRGLRADDIELIRRCGDPVTEGFVVTAKAVQRARAELQRLERLAGLAVIEIDNTVITVYRADKTRVRRLKSR